MATSLWGNTLERHLTTIYTVSTHLENMLGHVKSQRHNKLDKLGTS